MPQVALAKYNRLICT